MCSISLICPKYICKYTSTSLKTSLMSGLRTRWRWLKRCLTVWLSDLTRRFTASAWIIDRGRKATPNSSGCTSLPAFHASVNCPKPAVRNHSASSSPSVKKKYPKIYLFYISNILYYNIEMTFFRILLHSFKFFNIILNNNLYIYI